MARIMDGEHGEQEAGTGRFWKSEVRMKNSE
jgi:hypothetical protein